MNREPCFPGPVDCMICDLYKVIDEHLAAAIPPPGISMENGLATLNDGQGRSITIDGLVRDDDDLRDFVADLVTILPPRAHAFHDLSIINHTYTSRLSQLGGQR